MSTSPLDLFPTPPPRRREPLWSRRGLIYPDQLTTATSLSAPPPMWDRPGNRSPIFLLEPSDPPSSSPMWDRTPSSASSPGLPIFAPSRPNAAGTEMWEPALFPSPVCPCCLPTHLAMPVVGLPLSLPLPPPPPVPVPRSPRLAWAERPVTSAGDGLREVKRKKSAVGLRLKKSFQSLRRLGTDDVALGRRGVGGLWS